MLDLPELGGTIADAVHSNGSRDMNKIRARRRSNKKAEKNE